MLQVKPDVCLKWKAIISFNYVHWLGHQEYPYVHTMIQLKSKTLRWRKQSTTERPPKWHARHWPGLHYLHSLIFTQQVKQGRLLHSANIPWECRVLDPGGISRSSGLLKQLLQIDEPGLDTFLTFALGQYLPKHSICSKETAATLFLGHFSF